MKTTTWLVAVVACGALAACGDDETGDGAGGAGNGATTGGSGNAGGSGGTTGGSGGEAGGAGGSAGGTGGTGGSSGDMSLTSTTFSEGETLPDPQKCEQDGGDDASPQFSWSGGPAAQSYAIVMRDLDYMNGFVHWVIWDIPPATMSLPEGLPNGTLTMPAGAKQVAPGGGQGYFGPCSPSSVNTYEFTVYALDVPTLDLNNPNTTTAEAAVEAAALASASLSGES